MSPLKLSLALLIMLLGPTGLRACNSPLVFDLIGDGYIVTTSPIWYPLFFDLNGDGTNENTGWLAAGRDQGFLWLDLNRNGSVDGGQELFGNATVLPTGERASNGFQALAVYDRPEFGGNGDGIVDEQDLIWRYLRIWVDENFDGIAQQREVRSLDAWKIIAISLQYVQSPRVDGNGNLHEFVGAFFRRFTGRENRSEIRAQRVEDVFFRELPLPTP